MTQHYTDNTELSVETYKILINNSVNCPCKISQIIQKYNQNWKLPVARQPISNNILSTLLILNINIKHLQCKRPP